MEFANELQQQCKIKELNYFYIVCVVSFKTILICKVLKITLYINIQIFIYKKVSGKCLFQYCTQQLHTW